jgi:ATP-dependent DNA helicase RecG
LQDIAVFCRILQHFAGKNMNIELLLKEPESKTLEFKKDLSSINPILKTIVAFANTAGGLIIIGRSPEGNIVGIEDIFKAEEKLANAIADSISPIILPEIEIVTIQGKNLIVLKVSHWKGPFYIRSLGIPNGVFVRLGSTSRPAGTELIAELQRSTSLTSFDQQPLNELSKNSIDDEKVKKIFAKTTKKITEEKLLSLGVLTHSSNGVVPSIGGLILFGKEKERTRLVADARVSCARFAGDTKAEFLDQHDIEGTIIDAVDVIPKFILRNTRLKSDIHGMKRIETPEYPLIALREAIMNSLVHCDYSITGAHIQIAIFDNRLEIQNPGMFPFGFTLEAFKSGVSKIRNKVIAKVFRELGYIEEWGSGYKRIIDECNQKNYPQPNWEELGTFVRVTFYPMSLHREKDNNISSPISNENLTDREENILAILSSGESQSFQNIFRNLHTNMSERTLRYDLAQLKAKGLISSKGNARAKVWRLKK